MRRGFFGKWVSRAGLRGGLTLNRRLHGLSACCLSCECVEVLMCLTTMSNGVHLASWLILF